MHQVPSCCNCPEVSCLGWAGVHLQLKLQFCVWRIGAFSLPPPSAHWVSNGQHYRGFSMKTEKQKKVCCSFSVFLVFSVFLLV